MNWCKGLIVAAMAALMPLSRPNLAIAELGSGLSTHTLIKGNELLAAD
jgi:hypothetical protein